MDSHTFSHTRFTGVLRSKLGYLSGYVYAFPHCLLFDILVVMLLL